VSDLPILKQLCCSSVKSSIKVLPHQVYEVDMPVMLIVEAAYGMHGSMSLHFIQAAMTYLRFKVCNLNRSSCLLCFPSVGTT
jgi:hypothetical protein